MKRPIPQLPPGTETARRKYDDAVRENMEIIMGQRGNGLDPLPSTASTADIITAINALIARLQ